MRLEPNPAQLDRHSARTVLQTDHAGESGAPCLIHDSNLRVVVSDTSPNRSDTATKLTEPLAALLQTFYESRVCFESQKRLIKVLSREGG